jgi:hypothetical protein
VAIFSFFWKISPILFLKFENHSPHLGQKTFCGEFSPIIWRKIFSKNNCSKYTFSPKKKKKKS